jgi:hypothetical protein
MNNDQKGPIENFLDGLDEQSGSLSFDELEAELKNRGIDVNALLRQTDALIASHDKKERLAWMRVADEKKESLRVAETPSEAWHNKPEDVIRAAFALFLQARRGLAFRNRGDLSVQDMAAILEAEEHLARQEDKKADNGA